MSIYNGEIFSMVGATRAHNLITGNMITAFNNQLRGRGCESHPNDMRVKVSATGLYTYPDVVVVCGEPRFEDDILDTLLNPTLIVEVLLESTEAYDRGMKFEHYQSIETLREYILISQDHNRLEVYDRQEDNEWSYRFLNGREAKYDSRSVEVSVSLDEVCFALEFPKTPGPPSMD